MANTRRATKPVGYYAALNALSSADMFEKGQPATLESDDENVFLVDRIIAERHRRKVRNNHTYCPLNSQLQCRFWEVVAEVAYVSFLWSPRKRSVASTGTSHIRASNHNLLLRHRSKLDSCKYSRIDFPLNILCELKRAQ